MVEKDILEGQIGNIGAYDLEFKGGKLSFKLEVGKQSELINVKSTTQAEVPARAVLEALKKAIPGHLDDLAWEGLAKVLGV